MAQVTNTGGAEHVIDRNTGRQPRPPARRSAIWLVAATVGLVVFILLLGDMRRRYTALSHAEWYADAIAQRLGDSSALPLNLELDAPADLAPQQRKLEWLTREQVRALRGGTEPILVAHTRPVSRVLTPDGRAVVLFERGQFRAEWVSLRQFDELRAARELELRQRRGSSTPTAHPQP